LCLQLLPTAYVGNSLDKLRHTRSVAYSVELVLTAQLADKPTRGQSSRGLDNSRTGQLADSEFKKITELLYFICTLNLTLP